MLQSVCRAGPGRALTGANPASDADAQLTATDKHALCAGNRWERGRLRGDWCWASVWAVHVRWRRQSSVVVRHCIVAALSCTTNSSTDRRRSAEQQAADEADTHKLCVIFLSSFLSLSLSLSNYLRHARLHQVPKARTSTHAKSVLPNCLNNVA